MSAVADIDDLDTAFQTANRSTYKSGDFDLANLKDGDYLFRVVSAEYKPEKLFKLELELLTECEHAGGKIEKCWFFKKKENGVEVWKNNDIAELREALEKLGFDTPNWTKENGRPFRTEIAKVPAAAVGLQVVAKKKQGGKKEGGGYWQNLYVQGRGETDGKPEKIGAKELEDANVDPFGE